MTPEEAPPTGDGPRGGRRLPAAVAAALLLLIAAGAAAAVVLRTGSDSEPSPDRSAFAVRLGALCDATRTKIEALGAPAETPIGHVYRGTARLGRAFVASSRALVPPPGDAALVKEMLSRFALYYDGLAYALAFFEQGNQVAFVRIADGALANLDRAEAIARRLGVPECARRPFEDG